jgi:hypothetical protein
MNRLYLVRGLQATILYVNGKIGAEQGAQAAIDTVGLADQFRGVIAFCIGALGHGQHALGAELNTKAASFASFLNDVHKAMRHLDAISIQRLSPIRHDPSSILRRTDSWHPVYQGVD